MLLLAIAKLTGPFPPIAVPRSTSTQLPTAGVAPIALIAPGGSVGALVQLIPPSVQPLPTEYTEPPSGLASVTKRRSLTERTGPVRPLVVNAR